VLLLVLPFFALVDVEPVEAAGRFMLLASGVALALCVALAFDFAVDFALPLPLLFGVGADLRKSRQEMVSQATSGSVFVFRS
jgi:hypothetical protein